MSHWTRREFMLGSLAAAFACRAGTTRPSGTSVDRPNFVFVMCDDLGYGDTGFNGNPVVRTPHLDALRREGARFTRFYAGGPVCSPTRGTCMTGRHYARYGITHANEGHLPAQEITLGEIAREHGYRTGHFGKWHLGTLTRTERDGNRGGPENKALYAPPWEHGFDACFSTEAKMPTWNPTVTPAEQGNLWGEAGTPWDASYWSESGQRVTDNLEGDDSRVIVDRVEPFIRGAVAEGRPFLAVVWFHAPHAPVVAGPRYRALYPGLPEGPQHYFGCITAMDEQVGRLNALLKTLGVEDNTAVWFCSDNGPEGPGDGNPVSRHHGSTGGLRGRKRSLFNGGIEVPALVKWPRRVKPGTEYTMPCSTLDYLPTLVDALGYRMPDARPLDGLSLLPLLEGTVHERPRPIPYRYLMSRKAMFGSPTLAMLDNRYKFLTDLSESGDEDLCFDVVEDPGEQRNLAPQMTDYVARMRRELRNFVDSCRRSHRGADYPEPYTPSAPFEEWTGA